jgi:hypothetical protein
MWRDRGGLRFFEGDEDDDHSIGNGHIGADCGDYDGYVDDDKDEHFDNTCVEYINNDGNGNGDNGDHDEDNGIGGGTRTNQQSTTMRQ